MKIANRVRRIYERRPYPSPSLRENRMDWALAPIEWIRSMWFAPIEGPMRILVAGCGVGTEAFAFARRFPSAEIVAVDFSARSIAAARKEQRSTPHGTRIRFEIADITSSTLFKLAGRCHIVSCHGVLSYIEEPLLALRNLVRCLDPSGVLIMGVNGASHVSRSWRRLLPQFGIDPSEFRESARVRRALRLFDSLSGDEHALVEREAGYLAGDLFGPLNLALPLSEWNALCQEAGLHLLGNYAAFFDVRPAVNAGLHALVLPRSRSEVAGLLDELQPGSFHRVLYSRTVAATPSWRDPKALLDWRPALTPLFSMRLPARRRQWKEMRQVTLESAPTNTKISLSVPQWEVEILARSDGRKSLREILDPVRPAVPGRSLSEAMYLLYLVGAVNLLSPETGIEDKT
ncbi:MAG: class I SAM-dependent methyltransferase [Acidobacteriota bacterium]